MVTKHRPPYIEHYVAVTYSNCWRKWTQNTEDITSLHLKCKLLQKLTVARLFKKFYGSRLIWSAASSSTHNCTPPWTSSVTSQSTFSLLPLYEDEHEVWLRNYHVVCTCVRESESEWLSPFKFLNYLKDFQISHINIPAVQPGRTSQFYNQ
jgi:hypothetical protein